MQLSGDDVRALVIHYLGVDFGPEEAERLRPLVEQHFRRMNELLALDLGGRDPRTMDFIADSGDTHA
jgi:hypothetical protein